MAHHSEQLNAHEIDNFIFTIYTVFCDLAIHTSFISVIQHILR